MENAKQEESLSALPTTESPAAGSAKSLKEEKMRQHKEELEQKRKDCNHLFCLMTLDHPKENPNATKQPMKTLFIGNLNYMTPESRIRDICERYGVVEDVVLVRDREGKPRGYAFVEFADEIAFKDAYNVGSLQ